MRPLTRFFSFRDLGPVHLVRGLSQGTTMKGAAARAFGTQARATASSTRAWRPRREAGRPGTRLQGGGLLGAIGGVKTVVVKGFEAPAD